VGVLGRLTTVFGVCLPLDGVLALATNHMTRRSTGERGTRQNRLCHCEETTDIGCVLFSPNVIHIAQTAVAVVIQYVKTVVFGAVLSAPRLRSLVLFAHSGILQTHKEKTPSNMFLRPELNRMAGNAIDTGRRWYL
jgi:hypothetical protein